MAITKIAELQIQTQWAMDPDANGATIHARVEKSYIDTKRKSAPPGLRTVQKRVKELNLYRTEKVPLDPIQEPWAGDWPTDPESVETLLVLNDETNNICLLFGLEVFAGLTNRISKWACRIQKSFDLPRLHDRYLLLKLAIEFAMEERLQESTRGKISLNFLDMPHQTLMAWNRKRFNRDRASGIEKGYVRIGNDESAWPNVELSGDIPLGQLLHNIVTSLMTQIDLKQNKQKAIYPTEESVTYG